MSKIYSFYYVMLNSTLKPFKWRYEAHPISCNMSRCISRINGRYWWAQFVPHTVDCIDIRSRAHLPSACIVHQRKETETAEQRRKYGVHVCALKQSIENTQRPKAVCHWKEHKKMCLRLWWSVASVACVACVCMCTATPQRGLIPNSWQTGLIDGNITAPAICWMGLMSFAWLALKTQTTGRTLLEIWALFISQQPTMMTSLTPLCPSQFIT